ncbi:MAG: anhydro-N-acetylmuramic acid kinase [Acidobacteria bacterium]|nr:anhydro-N-acetylmuramic acid kinase [Acidobacteriota bacterium]
MTLALGLISGTSMDGVDAALVRISGEGLPEVVEYATFPYPEGVRVVLRRVQREGRLEALARLNVVLGNVFAEAANEILRRSETVPQKVSCIGSHGQTLLHLPEPSAEYGVPVRATLQIAESAVIAARTGVVTVSDFRAADMVLGGQGAPLVPWLDWKLYGGGDRDRILLNLGGVANLTWLAPNCGFDDVIAFDTGPANVLIDTVARARNLPDGRDTDGALAASGQVQIAVLEALLADPYYDAPWPKSADAAQFEWLLQRHEDIATEDLLATVTELTAATVADAVVALGVPAGAEILVAGGGVHNANLMERLGLRMDEYPFAPLPTEGPVHPDAKEAVAFAMMAVETLARRPSNVPGATGATGPAVLGKIAYPPAPAGSL